jgi:hypothetical protein
MPDPGKTKDTRNNANGRSTCAAGIQAQELSLRPLLRLRQLAGEIQSALRRGDMDVMGRASNLLAPAISQWAEARPKVKFGDEAGNAEMTRLTQETQSALTECESLMQAAMARIQAQSNRVRQHQQRLRRMRSLRAAPRTGRLLDTRR